MTSNLQRGKPVLNMFATGCLIANRYNKQCMNTKSVIPRRALQAGYTVQYLGRSSHARKQSVRLVEKVGIPYYDDIYFNKEFVYHDQPLHAVNAFLNAQWREVAKMPDEEFTKVSRTAYYVGKVWGPALKVLREWLNLDCVEGLFYEVSTLNSAQELLWFHLLVCLHLACGLPVVVFDSDRFVKKYSWRLGRILGKELPQYAENFGARLVFTAPELHTGTGSLCARAQEGAGYQTGQLFFPYDPMFPAGPNTSKGVEYELVYVGNDYDRQDQFLKYYAAQGDERIAVVGDFDPKARTKRKSTKHVMQEKGFVTQFPGPVPYTEAFNWYRKGKACVQIATKESCKSGYITPRVNDVCYSKRLLLWAAEINYVEDRIAVPGSIVGDKHDALAKARHFWSSTTAARRKRINEQTERVCQYAHIDRFWADLCGYLGIEEEVV